MGSWWSGDSVPSVTEVKKLEEPLNEYREEDPSMISAICGRSTSGCFHHVAEKRHFYHVSDSVIESPFVIHSNNISFLRKPMQPDISDDKTGKASLSSTILQDIRSALCLSSQWVKSKEPLLNWLEVHFDLRYYILTQGETTELICVRLSSTEKSMIQEIGISEEYIIQQICSGKIIIPETHPGSRYLRIRGPVTINSLNPTGSLDKETLAALRYLWDSSSPVAFLHSDLRKQKDIFPETTESLAPAPPELCENLRKQLQILSSIIIPNFEVSNAMWKTKRENLLNIPKELLVPAFRSFEVCQYRDYIHTLVHTGVIGIKHRLLNLIPGSNEETRISTSLNEIFRYTASTTSENHFLFISGNPAVLIYSRHFGSQRMLPYFIAIGPFTFDPALLEEQPDLLNVIQTSSAPGICLHFASLLSGRVDVVSAAQICFTSYSIEIAHLMNQLLHNNSDKLISQCFRSRR